MSEIRLFLKQKDKDGFAWTIGHLTFSEEEYRQILPALKQLEEKIPRLVLMAEKVEAIRL